MKYAYPATLARAEESGYIVRFRDVPEAQTQGETRAEALREAGDALIAALGGYVELGRAIPRPSRGRDLVPLPPLVAGKLALYDAMRRAKLSNSALGKKLGISEGAVRRLLDLDHRSHIGQVEAALAAMGKRLVVDIAEAA